MRRILRTWSRATAFLALAIAMMCPASASEPKQYAELRLNSPAEMQLVIYHDVWLGIFTTHGFGGYKRNNDYKATLRGEGPTYRDPDFYTYDKPSVHRGTITVDRKANRVVIDLQRVVSKPGDLEKLEPSPANGTYPIKKVTQASK